MTPGHDAAALLEPALAEWPLPLNSPLDPARIDTAQHNSLIWAEHFHLATGTTAQQRLRDLRAAQLAGYGYPRADDHILLLGIQWVTWFFLLDDLFEDGPTGATTDQSTQVTEPLHHILDAANTAAPQPAQSAGGLQAAFADLLDRTRVVMAPLQFRELSTHLHDYFHALVDETTWRERNTPPDLHTFLRLRRDTAPALPLLDLVEQAQNIRLPTSFYDSPEYDTMLGTAADIASWINDVFSAPKELAEDGLFNLVLIMHRSDGLTLPQAGRAAVARIKQQLQAFNDAQQRVQGDHRAGLYSDEGHAAIRSWASGLLAFQQHATWYFHHPRYGHLTPAATKIPQPQ
ncbi:terpene synthase family protein [Streptomyces hyderabadensis]|uniref:Terpene synthase n=1 Tax=Streptomyces hyderabadensis TaxID=598549 RepID=A0ABP9IWE0_9ACTN|nr:terpene synthase family protein [Streptomyces hyderabadensis]